MGIGDRRWASYAPRREEPQDVARLRKAGEAALRLDVRAMRKVLAPMLARDSEQAERESRDGRAHLDADDSQPTSHPALDHEPMKQSEDGRRARKEREAAIASTVADLKAKNRERARSGASPRKATDRQPSKS